MKYNSYKILVVDDNLTFVETLSYMIKTILGDKLLLLDKSYNGKDAIEMAIINHYNIIFMDVNMPEIDGIYATKKINRELYRQTRIICVSFNKDFETMNNMILSGAENYIYKDELTIEKIEKIFNEL